MHAMNDERFFDLAMKVIAHQCSNAERAEFDALLARQPELKAEFDRLQAEVRVAQAVLPLANAAGAAAGELPAYARGRLQAKVRQTLDRPQSDESEAHRSLAWGWRCWLGLAAAAAAVLLLLVPILRPAPGAVVQIAMLDLAGTTRGSNDAHGALLRQIWGRIAVQTFSGAEAFAAWEKDWPANEKGTVVKIVYDRTAAEVRVTGRRGGQSFSKTFAADTDLAAALKQAKAYIEQQQRE